MADKGGIVFGIVVRIDGVVMAEPSDQFGAVSVSKAASGGGHQLKYLAATMAWMQDLSSMMPTSVASSRETAGMLRAFGRRARQFDLFSSPNV